MLVVDCGVSWALMFAEQTNVLGIAEDRPHYGLCAAALLRIPS